MKYTRIRDLKEDNEMKQYTVAKIIGVSENQYGRYERGDNDIPLEKAVILAKYYNVSLDYIAGLTNDKRGFNKSDLTNSEIDLLKKFRSLSAEQKANVLGRIELFIEQNEEKAEKLKGAI